MGKKDSLSKREKIKQPVSKLTVPVNFDSDHIRGSVDTASITLVEYGDYECPYTGMAYPVVKELFKQFGYDRIYFAFRNFPLCDIHPHAQHAAEAAESASAQNRFWDMHDYLFEHQNALGDSHLVEYAKIVGVDIEKFKDDMSRHIYAPLIKKSLNGGIASGVEGTPTFFVNGIRYEDSFDLKTFSETLKSYLEK